MNIKNWAGLEPHATDDYVSWRSKEPVKEMKELRQCWQQALRGDVASLKKVLDAAYQSGRESEWEAAAGESL
jgi:hypothetical protein